MPRRVRRPRDKSELLNQLRRDLDSGGPFETYKDSLVFAATLGYHRHKRVPFIESDQEIAWDVFKTNDRALINMIAISESNDLNILSEERSDERLTIFEEYANGGLEILQNEVLDSTRPAFESISDFLVAMETKVDKQELPDLSQWTELLKGTSTSHD